MIDREFLLWALEEVGDDPGGCRFEPMDQQSPDHHGPEFRDAVADAYDHHVKEYADLLDRVAREKA